MKAPKTNEIKEQTKEEIFLEEYEEQKYESEANEHDEDYRVEIL